MGLQLKSLARLVETDVPVEAKAQQLQIDAAYTVDDGIVLCTGIGSIGVRAIRQVGLCGVDVHTVEQVTVHEAPVAFRVLLGQSALLVQVDGGHLEKIDVALVVPLHQLLVCAHRGASGGQA